MRSSAFASLLALGNGTVAAGNGRLAQLLAEDLMALAFARFPQIPSSRAFGESPAVTIAEYRMRIPSDPALAQSVPVPPRPFPSESRDPDLIPPALHASEYALLVWSLVLVIGIAFAVWWKWWRARRP